MKKESTKKGVVMKEYVKRSKGSMIIILVAIMAFTAIFGGCNEKKESVQTERKTVESARTETYTLNGSTTRWKEGYEYDARGNLTKIKKDKYDGDVYVEGSVQEYEYNDMGHMIKYRYGEVHNENGDADWKEQYKAVYDNKGNIKKEYHEDQGVSDRVIHKYDRHGIRRKTKIYEKGEDDKKEYLSTYRKYDFRGNMIKEEEFKSDGTLRQKTEYKYDDQGNMTIETTYGSADKIITEYDDQGHEIRETLYSDGKVDYIIEHEYDDRGNKTKTVKNYYGVGETSAVTMYEAEYDDQGNVTRSVEYDWHGTIESMTEYEYDDRGNKMKEKRVHSDENGTMSVTEREYDNQGNEIKKVEYDENGMITSVTEREYDKRGNEIKEVKYDENGMITSVTEREYDDQGDKIRSVEYDKEGMVVERSNLEYDDQGRPWKNTTRNADGNIIRLSEYLYDEKGYRTHAHTLGYDENGIIESEYIGDYEIMELTITISDENKSEYQSEFHISPPLIPERTPWKPATAANNQ